MTRIARRSKVIPSDPAWEAMKATRRTLSHGDAVRANGMPRQTRLPPPNGTRPRGKCRYRSGIPFFVIERGHDRLFLLCFLAPG
jgi:hypothetical protein